MLSAHSNPVHSSQGRQTHFQSKSEINVVFNALFKQIMTAKSYDLSLAAFLEDLYEEFDHAVVDQLSRQRDTNSNDADLFDPEYLWILYLHRPFNGKILNEHFNRGEPTTWGTRSLPYIFEKGFYPSSVLRHSNLYGHALIQSWVATWMEQGAHNRRSHGTPVYNKWRRQVEDIKRHLWGSIKRVGIRASWVKTHRDAIMFLRDSESLPGRPKNAFESLKKLTPLVKTFSPQERKGLALLHRILIDVKSEGFQFQSTANDLYNLSPKTLEVIGTICEAPPLRITHVAINDPKNCVHMKTAFASIVARNLRLLGFLATRPGFESFNSDPVIPVLRDGVRGWNYSMTAGLDELLLMED
jgi:hypothetical protein